MTPKHATDFPPDTRWVQFPGTAIAVVSPDEVYRVGPTGVIPLVFNEPKRRKTRHPEHVPVVGPMNPPAPNTGD